MNFPDMGLIGIFIYKQGQRDESLKKYTNKEGAGYLNYLGLYPLGRSLYL